MFELSSSQTEILGITLLVFIVVALMVVIFMMVLQAIGYKKILKQTKSYTQIIANTPNIAKILGSRLPVTDDDSSKRSRKCGIKYGCV